MSSSRRSSRSRDWAVVLMPATPIGGFFAASAMWKPRRVKWKHQKAREPGPGLIPPRGGHRAPESPGTWPWVEPSSGLTPRGGHGAAEPQPLVVPPFMLVQGPLSVLCPKRNCPDHKPKAAGNSKTVLGPANCSGEKEPQEYLPDSAPGSLADWLRAAAPKPFYHPGPFSWKTTFTWMEGRWFWNDSSTLHLLCTLLLLLLHQLHLRSSQALDHWGWGPLLTGPPSHKPQTFIPVPTSDLGLGIVQGNEENEWKLFFPWDHSFSLLNKWMESLELIFTQVQG